MEHPPGSPVSRDCALATLTPETGAAGPQGIITRLRRKASDAEKQWKSQLQCSDGQQVTSGLGLDRRSARGLAEKHGGNSVALSINPALFY